MPRKHNLKRKIGRHQTTRLALSRSGDGGLAEWDIPANEEQKEDHLLAVLVGIGIA
jgi:hypothetical protein